MRARKSLSVMVVVFRNSSWTPAATMCWSWFHSFESPLHSDVKRFVASFLCKSLILDEKASYGVGTGFAVCVLSTVAVAG